MNLSQAVLSLPWTISCSRRCTVGRWGSCCQIRGSGPSLMSRRRTSTGWSRRSFPSSTAASAAMAMGSL
jgi:hypothetical protein